MQSLILNALCIFLNWHSCLQQICCTRPHPDSHTLEHGTPQADLDIPGLSPAACHGHIVPQLATQPLLSIGQLCDSECNILFTAKHITIHHNNNNIILQGHQTKATKLWELNIQPVPPTTHSANASIDSTSRADLVAFVHAALFSPALSTLAKALCHGHLPEFVGLMLQCLRQHPPSPWSCSKGTWIKSSKTNTPPSQKHLASPNSAAAIWTPSHWHLPTMPAYTIVMQPCLSLPNKSTWTKPESLLPPPVQATTTY